MNRLLKRLPDRQSIIGVYATAVFVIYGWTLLRSFWKVPSWSFFLSIGEILSVYAYAFVVAFLESMLVLSILLLIGFVLPSRWWNDRFTSMGVIWLVVIEGSVMLRLYTNRAPEFWESFLNAQASWWTYTVLLALALTLLAVFVKPFQRGLELIADRFVVFLYLYMPLTVLSFLVVVLRNIL